MTKYIVEVRIPIVQFQNVTVEANTEDEAKSKAIKLAEIGLAGDWLDDPDSAGDFYTGDVIESDEPTEEDVERARLFDKYGDERLRG